MTEGRVIAHMVTRNERDRYLEATVPWLRDIVDGRLHVHDDHSDDGTFEYLVSEGVSATQRSPSQPSFREHEGKFRQAGWRAMEAAFRPTTADWILCIDADEMLLASEAHQDARAMLDLEVKRAETEGFGAIRTHVAEFFGFADGIPQMRMDGLWGTIDGIRLVRWQPTGGFLAKEEASGSVPWGWTDPHCASTELTIAHFGYVRPADRQAKYERYSACRGHARHHIESILATPQLAPWAGQQTPLVVSE